MLLLTFPVNADIAIHNHLPCVKLSGTETKPIISVIKSHPLLLKRGGIQRNTINRGIDATVSFSDARSESEGLSYYRDCEQLACKFHASNCAK